jgi:hypothetical protein
MKKHTLHTLLVAGVLLCGASVSLADEPLLVRQARTLACLSADMDAIYHDDLRAIPQYRSISRSEVGFRESLCQLSALAAQFRDHVDQRANAHDLERSYASVQEAFACVQANMTGVTMRTSIRGMVQQFCQGLNCVENIDLAAFARYQPAPRHDSQHQHQHGGEVHGGGTRAGGIYLRVPIQQSTPFLFRQPIR